MTCVIKRLIQLASQTHASLRSIRFALKRHLKLVQKGKHKEGEEEGVKKGITNPICTIKPLNSGKLGIRSFQLWTIHL